MPTMNNATCIFNWTFADNINKTKITSIKITVDCGRAIPWSTTITDQDTIATGIHAQLCAWNSTDFLLDGIAKIEFITTDPNYVFEGTTETEKIVMTGVHLTNGKIINLDSAKIVSRTNKVILTNIDTNVRNRIDSITVTYNNTHTATIKIPSDSETKTVDLEDYATIYSWIANFKSSHSQSYAYIGYDNSSFGDDCTELTDGNIEINCSSIHSLKTTAYELYNMSKNNYTRKSDRYVGEQEHPANYKKLVNESTIKTRFNFSWAVTQTIDTSDISVEIKKDNIGPDKIKIVHSPQHLPLSYYEFKVYYLPSCYVEAEFNDWFVENISVTAYDKNDTEHILQKTLNRENRYMELDPEFLFSTTVCEYASNLREHADYTIIKDASGSFELDIFGEHKQLSPITDCPWLTDKFYINTIKARPSGEELPSWVKKNVKAVLWTDVLEKCVVDGDTVYHIGMVDTAQLTDYASALYGLYDLDTETIADDEKAVLRYTPLYINNEIPDQWNKGFTLWPNFKWKFSNGEEPDKKIYTILDPATNPLPIFRYFWTHDVDETEDCYVKITYNAINQSITMKLGAFEDEFSGPTRTWSPRTNPEMFTNGICPGVIFIELSGGGGNGGNADSIARSCGGGSGGVAVMAIDLEKAPEHTIRLHIGKGRHYEGGIQDVDSYLLKAPSDLGTSTLVRAGGGNPGPSYVSTTGGDGGLVATRATLPSWVRVQYSASGVAGGGIGNSGESTSDTTISIKNRLNTKYGKTIIVGGNSGGLSPSGSTGSGGGASWMNPTSDYNGNGGTGGVKEGLDGGIGAGGGGASLGYHGGDGGNGYFKLYW